jgi:murein DD-endopeptidase MepM/ murein hydrolase activator NlpD
MGITDTAPVIDTDGKAIVLDLSSGSRLRGEPVADLDVSRLGQLIDEAMADAGTGFAFGRYAEPRELYKSEHFTGGAESRTVHLGLDLFCTAGSPVFAPLDGRVELLANNARELDYGPMLVLRHEGPDRDAFFTLYGHLGPEVLDDLQSGQAINAGQQIATVGSPPGNGNWPPHLHFQLILDLKDLGADFPGVASASEPAFFPEYEAQELEYEILSHDTP